MKIKKIFFFIAIIIFFLYIGLLCHNNISFSKASKSDIDNAYKKSITWLNDNQEELYNHHNSMLWWMLIEALKIEDDPTIRHIVDSYKRKNYQRHLNSPWRYLIYDLKSEINASDILKSNLPDYNIHFIYGFSCNQALAHSEIIKAQNQIGFCFNNHPLSPACLTHQLMGFRFMQRYNCNSNINLESNIEDAAKKIAFQLFFDVRFVDVYIQRVLMLIDSDKQSKINQRWINRIIEGQLDNGGWGNFQPLLPIGSQKYIGFSAKGLTIKSPKSTFHATAQGILLMSLLKNNIPSF